ncbi:Dyp-type peroxidase family [Paucibacter oligotrophus]|uniref:Dyp-type peroxidase family n=1 Tax=Roseateles oligotrophus TaxID=1769250 RepID=A0A840L7R4_9BURK|nr:Dyp-type peroxidase [Roseateles oligotrophus]MBB4842722.1 Dyp-type peroxidase family [Roseateles oligotrophus]
MSFNKPETQLQGITDLVLITPIKAGFVTAFETISYVDRLRRVLKSLNALRLGARESSEVPGLFTDVVSRFRIVHSFRWAIIEPKPDAPLGEPHKLLLNVCFDGGWEPYMRVIWDQLGSMLDLILCHAEGYQLAKETSFERYKQWVRAHEISADFLYFESGRSTSDHEYLAALEWQQRELHPSNDLPATQLHTGLPGASNPLPDTSQMPARMAMALRGLPALATLYTLERYFLAGAPDGLCLIRAARDILFELVELDTASLFPPASPLREAYYRMLDWFEKAPPKVELPARALDYSDADIQGGMLTAYPDLQGGAMVLLRVTQAAKALAYLSSLTLNSEADTMAGKKPADGFYRNLALSLSGLRALGVSNTRLERFPQPFIEGMEARAGVLGDVRHNHPRYWKLPTRNWPEAKADGRPVDLGAVHLLIQLRHGALPAGSSLEAAIHSLEQDTGLQVLSVQAMRRGINPKNPQQTRESFGFVDGISQPQVGEPGPQTPAQPWSDAVHRGELLLGFRSDRDSCAVPEAADALLDKGSFLVVRKLRQYVDRLHHCLDTQAPQLGLNREELLGKMMGRWTDGTPLAAPSLGASNGFNYSEDAKGSACPFHAHIRRANPRTDIPGLPVPRILRRGMSYGPVHGSSDSSTPDAEDRGLIFMAYNANLAEQFEIIQRWISGGNASGGYGPQADPFLGVAVPQTPAAKALPATTPRIYRFEHQGRVLHLNLGDQPFVELQWGAYFFVPSLPALRLLPALVELPAFPTPIAVPSRAPAPDDAQAWQQWLEDSSSRDAAWAYVRSQPGGVLRTAYGVLVGEAREVCEVFRDRESRYSVTGYGSRMAQSIGRGYLGMDEDSGHAEQAPLINAAIESIDEASAFTAAHAVAAAVVAKVRGGAQQLHLKEGLLDVEQLSEHVLAALCKTWFGLPDGQAMWGTEWHAKPADGQDAPRCPRDFFAVSRFVFGPHPSELVGKVASKKGQGLQAAVKQWLAAQAADAPLPKLSQAIKEALQGMSAQDPDIVPRTIAGIMLGFPPTVHGNTVGCLGAWIVSKKLWDVQQDWPRFAAGTAPAQIYAQAVASLRPTLIATMVGRPVPGMVWRTARKAHRLAGVEVQQGDTVIVGIASATQQDPRNHTLMFGGDRRDAVLPAPLHACSGYAMAMGVMLGVAAAVLEAGTLRFTGSPTVLGLQV